MHRPGTTAVLQEPTGFEAVSEQVTALSRAAVPAALPVGGIPGAGIPATLAGEAAVATVLEQIDLTRRMIVAYPQALELALTAATDVKDLMPGNGQSGLAAHGGTAALPALGGEEGSGESQ